MRVRGGMSGNAKFLRIFLSAVIISATIIPLFQNSSTYAAQITTRSLALQTGDGGDGGSKISGVVKHEFNFTVPNVGSSSIGSIKFEYCTTASGTCAMPAGLITNAGSTALEHENNAIGFTLVKTTNGSPYLTRPASVIAPGTGLTYRLKDITNPNTATSFFVRISTYSAADLGGSIIDTGTVAASTSNQITLSGVMPESIIFCAGAIIEKTSNIPDCTKASAGAVSFNQLFSPTDTATATSQMAASTNASSGYTISVFGPTLTSGGNTIAPMASQDLSIRGKGQFGLNLKLNTVATSTLPVGAEIDAASNGTDLRGQAAAGYNTVDNFKFVSGESVANSANGSAGPTNAQIFTVSYIVNVAGSQIAGTYTSTLTYVCTATF